jgi:hypothetical protein
MRNINRLCTSIILTTLTGFALLPTALASSITISANPASGTIYNFPAAGFYEDFSSDLTVAGAVSGTPTWSAAPATGSPSCASHIFVTFGNLHVWNTTATFDDASIYGCRATMILTVSSTSGLIESIGVQVSYVFCAHCT